MQNSFGQPALRPLTLFFFGVAISISLILAHAPAGSTLFPFQFISTAQAEYEFDHSADTIDYRNNRLPEPYKPAGYGLFNQPVIQQEVKLVPKVEEPVNIWPAIRAGFKLGEFDSKLVKRHEKRFTRNPKHFERILERAEPYLPYILEQTNRYSMPTEVVLLPLIESGYNPRIYSSRGAAGLWQFMPATGRHYGLKQNWWYEGRRDITFSTDAALRHLRDLNELFDGDWPLSFAAYNAGHNGINRAIRSNKRKNKPTDLKSLRLNSETRNFYPKLIAVKNIIQNPDKFGIKLPEISTRSPFQIVEFDFQVDLIVLSRAINVESLQLALLNPGLRRHATPPDGPFRVLVPRDKHQETLDWKRDLRPAGAVVSVIHVVQAGDTLSELAQKFGVPVASLMTINAKSTDLIRIGEIIRVPHGSNLGGLNEFGGADIVHRVVSGDSLSRIAQSYGIRVSELRAANGIGNHSDLIRIGQKLRIPDTHYANYANSLATASASDLRSRTVHRVVSGESLWSIARKYKIRVLDLINWNKISRSAHIHPGQKLVVYIY